MSTKTVKYNDRPSHNSQVADRTLIETQPMKDVMEYACTYARANPEAAAFWCFGIGFVLGWKLKPW